MWHRAVLMMVVPTSQLYVDANFKESQLEKDRPGQKAVLTSDLYGDSVEYHTAQYKASLAEPVPPLH